MPFPITGVLVLNISGPQVQQKFHHVAAVPVTIASEIKGFCVCSECDSVPVQKPFLALKWCYFAAVLLGQFSGFVPLLIESEQSQKSYFLSLAQALNPHPYLRLRVTFLW